MTVTTALERRERHWESVASDREVVRSHHALIVVLVVAAIVRLGLWFSFAGSVPQVWDEKDYDILARNVVSAGEFAFERGHPISLRPPLFPALVAVLYRVAGVGNYQAVRLALAGISLLTAAVVYLLGKALYSRKVGLGAAALMAFYPSMLVYNNLMLTEVLFTFFLASGTLCVIEARKQASLRLLAIGGVTLGLGALTRSALWPFPAVLSVWLALTWPGGRARAAAAILVMLAAFSATLAPWAIRNARLERTFQPVDCMGGRNLMMGNYEYTPLLRAWDAISASGEQSWHRVLADADPTVVGLTQGQLDKRAMRYAVRYVASNPGLTVERDVVKFFNFWGLEREVLAGVSRGMYGVWSRPSLVVLALAVVGSYALVIVAGVFGALVVPRHELQAHALILLVVGYLTAIHTLSFGHSRYHLPLIPLIVPYAAALLASGSQMWSQRRSARFVAASAIAFVLFVAWAAEIFVLYRSDAAHVVPGLA